MLKNNIFSISDIQQNHLQPYDPNDYLKIESNSITNKKDLEIIREMSNENKDIFLDNRNEKKKNYYKSFDDPNNNIFSMRSINNKSIENENNQDFNAKFLKNFIFGD